MPLVTLNVPAPFAHFSNASSAVGAADFAFFLRLNLLSASHNAGIVSTNDARQSNSISLQSLISNESNAPHLARFIITVLLSTVDGILIRNSSTHPYSPLSLLSDITNSNAFSPNCLIAPRPNLTIDLSVITKSANDLFISGGNRLIP